jgi:hypothetical protein
MSKNTVIILVVVGVVALIAVCGCCLVTGVLGSILASLGDIANY